MAKEPVVLASPAAFGSRFQMESVSGRITIATLGDHLTGAGCAAVLAVLSTYYSSTLSATQLAALKNVTGDNYVSVSSCEVFAAVAPGTDVALGVLLLAAVKVSGNTSVG